jgi:hypothetical protein
MKTKKPFSKTSSPQAPAPTSASVACLREALVEELAPGVSVRILRLPALLQMKRSAGRPQDLADVDELNLLHRKRQDLVAGNNPVATLRCRASKEIKPGRAPIVREYQWWTSRGRRGGQGAGQPEDAKDCSAIARDVGVLIYVRRHKVQ